MPADGWLGTDVRTAALCLYAPVEDSSENTKFVHAGVCPNKRLKNHIQDYLMKNSSLFFVTIRTAALRSANSVGYGKKKKKSRTLPYTPPEAALYWPNTVRVRSDSVSSSSLYLGLCWRVCSLQVGRFHPFLIFLKNFLLSHLFRMNKPTACCSSTYHRGD